MIWSPSLYYLVWMMVTWPLWPRWGRAAVDSSTSCLYVSPVVSLNFT